MLETPKDLTPPGARASFAAGAGPAVGGAKNWLHRLGGCSAFANPLKTVDCITSVGREFGQTYLPAGAEFLGVSPRAARHDSISKRSGGSSVGANTAEFLSVHCQRERLRFASVTARLATGP